jgi:hypothetical protein
MKVNTSVALRAGVIGAVAGLAVAILSRISFLGCIIGPLGWIVAVATGALYVHLASRKVDLAEGAVGGGIAGAIAGAANSLVSGVLTLIFGGVGAASTLLEGELGAAALQAGASVFGVITGIVVGIVVGAVLGAIGGPVYALIKNR